MALILITFFSFFLNKADAGIVEVASRAMYAVQPGPGETCNPSSEAERQRALEEIRRCQAPGFGNDLRLNTLDLRSVAETVQAQNRELGNSESQFFELLARENQKELTCAYEFSDELVKTPEAVDLLSARFLALREAKQRVITLAEGLNDLNTPGAAHCPSDSQELRPNPGIVEMLGVDAHYEKCVQLISARAAVRIIEDSIPLRGSKEVADLVDAYSTAKTAPENLAERLKAAYTKTSEKARADEKKISQIVANKEGFSRAEKRAFMSDALLVENLVKKNNDNAAFRDIVCTANASYGEGADNLDRALFVLPWVIMGATTAVLKTSAHATKVATGLNEARRQGFLSFASAQSVQTAALFSLGTASVAASSLKAMEVVDRACFNPSRFKLVQGAGACVGTPKVSDLEKDNCVVAASLSAASLLLPGTLTNLAAQKLANERLIEIIDRSRKYAIDPFRTSRRRVGLVETAVNSSIGSYQWSTTRYGGRNPWDYQRDLKNRATELNQLSERKERLVQEKSRLESESNSQNRSVLYRVDRRITELDEEIRIARSRFDELAPPEVTTYLGEEADEIGISRSMRLPNNLTIVPSNDPTVRKGTFWHRTRGKRYRYSVVTCNLEEGCPRGEETIAKGEVIAMQPECGPDVFKVNMSGSMVLERIRNQTFNPENITHFVPLPLIQILTWRAKLGIPRPIGQSKGFKC